MDLNEKIILIELNPSRNLAAVPRAGRYLATTEPLPGRKPFLTLLMRLLCAAALVLAAFGVSAAGVFTTLYSFTGGNDGASPQAGLVQGSDGYFYSTTTYGGARAHGTVFKISAAGALTNLYSFTGGADGGEPLAALVEASDGYFYGMTTYGGSGDYGTVFKISADGTLTSFYTFTNGTDGGEPRGALVRGSDGYFYGTTSYGGAFGQGVVFNIRTNGALTSLYAFTNGLDGAYPSAALVQGSDGYFYSTTTYGGAYGQGTVFKISAAGALTSLHSFTGGSGGSNPYAGLVQGSDGYFYGTTYGGGSANDGTVFKISATGALTNLYAFTGSDGSNPSAGLVQGSDGYFYGTTFDGGLTNDGTVFKITATGALISLHSFGLDDRNPVASLIQGNDGNLYGTSYNGLGPSAGTVFRLTAMAPPWITTQPISISTSNGTVASFSVIAAGTPPLGYQWQLSGTNLANAGGFLGGFTNILSLTVTAGDAGGYSVIVTNAYGSVASIVATLTVIGGGIPPGAVALQAAPLSGGLWSLGFQTALGQSYTIQQNANLWTTNWVFYTNLTGNGLPAQLVLPVGDASSQFFRVLEPY
jgi:uncharacterized repeat protein (TIGR03803 family)